VNPSQIQIGVDGTVSGMLPNSVTPQQFGTIGLFRFINPAGLSSEGGNLYQATAASGNEVQGIAGQNGFGSIRQGFVERSNVEVVTELISLISAQRAYEINSRAVRAGDEMLSVTADIVR
jgi:flagellar basal-body rod protein FlgG